MEEMPSPKHAGPEAEGSNPTTGLTLLWARNPFGGNFNNWQVSWEEAGQTHSFGINFCISCPSSSTCPFPRFLSLSFGSLKTYKRNWIQHVNRMPRNRLPRVMKRCSPTGGRNHGRPLRRLLDTWDRNGSTSDPTPWQVYDDDDDDEDVRLIWNVKTVIQT